MLTAGEALDVLERAIEAHPSASAWCREHAISRHLLSDVRAGRAPMTAAIAEAIGLQKVTAYVETEWCDEWMAQQRAERSKTFATD